ncbi:MAG TPA: hypothetical protein DGT23_09880 [Micromonosporaceae bacterium]|nr:hypothetical protein [Micromonosporaceae bacterium]
MRFDRYTVILLTLRPDAPVMTDEEAAELQDRHLAHGADLQDRGLIPARGPRTGGWNAALPCPVKPVARRPPSIQDGQRHAMPCTPVIRGAPIK